MPIKSPKFLLTTLLFLGLTLNIIGCATRTNFVKDGGDYQTDSLQCKEEDLATVGKSGDTDKPNELNTPKDLKYVSPFEACMVSKGWRPEKTEFRLNSLKMTW